MSVVSLKSARGLEPDEEKTFRPVPITGTPLEYRLPSGETTIAQIGGALFVDLLNSLDALVPFSHPNFDILLSEAFVEFYGISHKSDYVVGQLELRDFVMTPEVNQKLLALLRGDSRLSEKYAAAFQRAAREVESPFGFTLGSGDANSHLGRITDELERFQKALYAEPDVSADASRLAGLDQNSVLSECINTRPVPKHDLGRGTSVSAHLRNLFRAFHTARRKVDDVVNSEPLFALMMAWAFCKFDSAGGPAGQTETIWDRCYKQNGELPKGLTDEEHASLQKEFRDGVSEGMRRDSENESVVAEVFAKHATESRRRAYARSREYTHRELRAYLAKTFKRLAVLLVPGAEQLLEELDGAIENSRRAFRKYEEKRDGDLTVDILHEVLKGEASELIAWLEKTFSTKDVKLSGMDLAADFEKAFVQFEIEQVKRLSDEFINSKATEINKLIPNAEVAYKTGLEGMQAPEGGVAQAPPGGTLAGVVPPFREYAGHDDAVVEASIDKVRQRDLEHRRARRGNIAGENNPPDAATSGIGQAAQSDDSTGTGDDATNGNGDTGDSPGSTESLGIFAVEELLSVDAQAEAEQKIEELRAQLFDNLRLHEDSRWATQRAQMRALLCGEYMLASAKSPLSITDRSLGAHFLLRMVETIGATVAYEGENRAKLASVETDHECGVLEMPMQDILQVSPGQKGREDVSGFVTAWTNMAKELETLAEDIADFEDVVELFEDLAKSGQNGKVTIINETIEEHAGREPTEQRIIAAPASRIDGPEDPPGIVYVTRQAGTTKGDGISLEPIAQHLFDQKDVAPLYRENEKTVLQQYEQPYANNLVWSMPVFVGRNLNGGEKARLPLISVDMPALSAAVICLAGLSPSTNRWKETIGKRAEVFGELRTDGQGGGRIGRGNYLGEAWRMFLLDDIHLASQCTSKIISHTLLSSVSHTQQRPSSFAAALRDTVNDLEKTYKNNDLRRRILIGEDHDEMPKASHTLAKIAPIVVIGKGANAIETPIADLFRLL